MPSPARPDVAGAFALPSTAFADCAISLLEQSGPLLSDLVLGFADGLHAIKHVLNIMMGSDSSTVSVDQQLLLKSTCEPVAEALLEPVLRHPQTKALLYILLPSEAAVLAYCWNLQYFNEDCQPHIYNTLYKSLCVQGADAGSRPDGDTTVDRLLHAVKQSRWKPGLLPCQPVQNCFPAGTTCYAFLCGSA